MRPYTQLMLARRAPVCTGMSIAGAQPIGIAPQPAESRQRYALS